MNTVPFTYRVFCIPANVYYYGVKYARGCNPSDLWTKYFTSSAYVLELRHKYGDECWKVEIRRTFSDPSSAIVWEQRVLSKILNWDNYLNEHSGTAFSVDSCVRGGRISGRKCYEESKGMYSISNERRSEISRKNGIFSGNKNSANGIGLAAMTNEERIANGKKGGTTSKLRKVGYMDPLLNSKGGKITGPKSYEEGFGIFSQTTEEHLINSIKGGHASKGFVWWNNGKQNTKSITSPGPEWERGQIKGKLLWWNNGKINARGEIPPEANWIRGKKRND